MMSGDEIRRSGLIRIVVLRCLTLLEHGERVKDCEHMVMLWWKDCKLASTTSAHPRSDSAAVPLWPVGRWNMSGCSA